jgi:hypothetical protein
MGSEGGRERADDMRSRRRLGRRRPRTGRVAARRWGPGERRPAVSNDAAQRKEKGREWEKGREEKREKFALKS